MPNEPLGIYNVVFGVEELDASMMLEAEGIQTVRIETATGVTCEACDPSSNRIGFADYGFKTGQERLR